MCYETFLFQLINPTIFEQLAIGNTFFFSTKKFSFIPFKKHIFIQSETILSHFLISTLFRELKIIIKFSVQYKTNFSFINFILFWQLTVTMFDGTVNKHNCYFYWMWNIYKRINLEDIEEHLTIPNTFFMKYKTIIS